MQINKKKNKKKTPESVFGVPREARTLDPLIKSQLLYQLSHGVKKRNHFVDFRLQRYN